MKSLTKIYLASVLAVAGVIVTAALPAKANEPGYTLTLSGPSRAAAGKPFTITATGTDLWDTYLPIPAFAAQYLNVDAMPTRTTTTCPSGYQTATQLADSTGGAVVAAALNETPDAQGNFSVTVGYTPRAPGQVLICAYTEDGLTGTYATTSLMVTVTSARGGGPVNVVKPRVTRSGKMLACTRGTWSHAPRRFAYGWLVDGKVGSGARGPHLAVTPQLRGHTVRCSVTATNAGGAATATSPSFFVR